MNLNYTFRTMLTRKYNQIDLSTGEAFRVTVTNNNYLPMSKQLELLNKYDTEHLYTEMPNYQQE